MDGLELQRQVRALVDTYGGLRNDNEAEIASLGLCGEAGEVANDVKKHLYGMFTLDELRERSTKELKDCLWYIAAIANCVGLNLQTLIDETPAHIELKLMAAQGWVRKGATNVQVSQRQ